MVCRPCGRLKYRQENAINSWYQVSNWLVLKKGHSNLLHVWNWLLLIVIDWIFGVKLNSCGKFFPYHFFTVANMQTCCWGLLCIVCLFEFLSLLKLKCFGILKSVKGQGKYSFIHLTNVEYWCRAVKLQWETEACDFIICSFQPAPRFASRVFWDGAVPEVTE